VSKKKFVVKKLIWDRLNITHIARHDVIPDEVKEVCKGNPVERKGHKNRLFLIGKTKADRMLTVILNPTEIEEVYRPITAYDASKSSIKTYEEVKRGGESI
jgi:uncharacterized DUF497 family protein